MIEDEAQGMAQDAAQADADAAAAGRGYKPPHRRTSKVSRMIGDEGQGPTRLDRVAENAKKKIPGMDGVRDRLESVDRHRITPEEMREFGADPAHFRPYFCNTEEQDRQLKNPSRTREVLQRCPGAFVMMNAEGKEFYEGGTHAIALPLEMDERRDARISARRDELDAELELARRGAEGPVGDDERAAIAENARRASIAGQSSPTRGLSLEEAYARIPKEKRQEIEHRALMRAPMVREGPKDNAGGGGKRTFFDMGRGKK
jgi:hypothetical protein